MIELGFMMKIQDINQCGNAWHGVIVWFVCFMASY